MSEIDIYDVSENLISSDEYSEEDDDELMNAAISSQHYAAKSSNGNLSYSTTTSPQRSRKHREHRFSRKLCMVYKTRCVKWLNGKQKRDKYKQYMISMKPKTSSAHIVESPIVKETTAATAIDVKKNIDLSETINLEESDVESSPNKNSTTIQHIGEEVYKLDEEHKKEPETALPVNEPITAAITVEPITNCQKRVRSPTPPTVEMNCNYPKKHQSEQQETEKHSMSLYKQINDMFPKYDEVLGKHVTKTNSTIDAIDENMTRLLLDIQTLNDILHTKEVEWNRLLHLKRVKEEILARLERKKHIIELKDKKLEDQRYNLKELKELELYLAESRPSTTSNNSTLSTAHQLIENRANMKTEDLQRERMHTNRLQSILVSSNILQRAEDSISKCNAAKNESSPKHHTAFTDPGQDLTSYQYLEHKINKSNIGRQGPFKDVKSIIADFRQKNPDVFPRVGKRIKTNDTNCSMHTPPHISQNADTNSILIETSYNGTGSNYTPTLEKLLSTSSRNSNSNNYNAKASVPYSQGFKFNCDGGQKSYYRLQDDGICNEISITPISGSSRYAQASQACKAGLLRTALNTHAQHNAFYDMSGHKDLAENIINENELQLCQECKTHEARFVCAGCGNQWYCSRRCQISAWDKHSDVCNE